MEKKIMISLKILNPNSLLRESLEALKNGKVLWKRKRLRNRGRILWPSRTFKSKEELEEVAQDHEVPHPLPLGIQESKERFHPFLFLSGEMGIGDEDPVLFGANQCLPSPPHTAIVKS
jgi:hypothetical protein